MDKHDDGLEAQEPPQRAIDAGTQETATEANAERLDTQSLETPVSPLATGQIVEGLIVHIDEQGALVDVGTKSEGHIPVDELAGGTTDEGKALEVGDRVAVYVVRPEDEEGNPVLSKKKADYERVWQRLTRAFETGEVMSTMVTDRVKGGLVVDLGMRGFLPASHVRAKNIHALDRFVGQSVRVKIVEVDRARKRVVVSQKDAMEEERRKRREQTLATLEENRIYKGVVRRLTDYGAFVDIGGVDGLLHITEMSWTRINHPGEVVKVGDNIDVVVLRYDREQNRISLGLKQILPDPWEQVRDTFKVGQMVAGTVTRVVPFGAFVRLETGIEGIIPNAELPGGRGQRAQDALSAGESVQAKVMSIRASERRMTLSLRQVQQAQERRELKEYMDRQQVSSRVTIGDLVGDVFEAQAEATARSEADEVAAQAAEEVDAQVTGSEPGLDEPGEQAEGKAAESESTEWSSSESPAESEAGNH
jgi:4-hydroxy-3-methylbut-2-enyl diphosphate reductase